MHIQGFVGALQMRTYQWGVFRFGVDGNQTAKIIRARRAVRLLMYSHLMYIISGPASSLLVQEDDNNYKAEDEDEDEDEDTLLKGSNG
ncbi:hypothetical protein F4813DRAFT_375280 [Daldinia decipiens]|uniref:uncharacterized protein n=1 Tax=Daldinia decipiens TaxID=326647 RepID=UPI0020C4AB5B|nr:uncharacterized protein F4813DRAFT_375280 [Daldinia decipiens]KAI1653279.1 hypothetical protein F4813DRAFT_375280 [Daldinia decipiens]